jgi:uncharacterized membrane protein YkvA (DUF1232 family)
LSSWAWLAVALGATAALWLLLIVVLLVLGRRSEARELARFLPDCIVFCKRLLRDDRVPLRAKVLLGLLVPYLLMPLDVVPDFIPVAGQLDDAILVAAAIAYIARSTGREVVEELWPGSESGLRAVLVLSKT